MKTIVSGIIQLREASKYKGCPVHIKVLDTSFADEPARLVAEKVVKIADDSLHHGQQLSFELPVNEPIQTTSTYTVAVHVDVDEDGEISQNDYIQKQSYPVLTYNNKAEGLSIELRQV